MPRGVPEINERPRRRLRRVAARRRWLSVDCSGSGAVGCGTGAGSGGGVGR